MLNFFKKHKQPYKSYIIGDEKVIIPIHEIYGIFRMQEDPTKFVINFNNGTKVYPGEKMLEEVVQAFRKYIERLNE